MFFKFRVLLYKKDNLCLVKEVEIIKSNGEKRPFSWHKVYRSVKRSGAPSGLAKEVANRVQKEVQNGWTTLQISKRVREMLQERRPSASIKFNLFWAMTQLGPTGFPFERYVARIFETQGFETSIGQWVQGKCVRHQVDFFAEDGKTTYLGECKYHNLRGRKTSLNVILHYFARFEDLCQGPRFSKARRNKALKTVLVTNTRFTSEAIKYGNCVGQELLGWKYPSGHGLERIIDEHKIYPITILPSFKGKSSVEIFAKEGLILAEDVLTRQKQLEKLALPAHFLSRLEREARQLFGPEKN